MATKQQNMLNFLNCPWNDFIKLELNWNQMKSFLRFCVQIVHENYSDCQKRLKMSRTIYLKQYTLNLTLMTVPYVLTQQRVT